MVQWDMVCTPSSPDFQCCGGGSGFKSNIHLTLILITTLELCAILAWANKLYGIFEHKHYMQT